MEKEKRAEADGESMANQSSDGSLSSLNEDEVAVALKENISNIIGASIQGPTGRSGTIIRVDPEDRLLPIKVKYDDGDVPEADWLKCEDVYCIPAEANPG